ncbi:MAG: flagellin [Selenomonadaceae bacterium]|nr:flagellin [Selenomonadaceae bacterium]
MYVQGDTKSSLETRIQLPNTTLSILFPEANSDWDIVPTPADYPVEWSSDYANLTDAEKVRKWEDEEWSYPRKGAIASGSCVLNRTNANKFLEDIDQALKYLLHAATSLGAQCQRMDAMGENIVTGNENTQASESTIRDADMAREMVAYTKANVIFQSSQSMLAQANQSLSSVLGLLQ